MMSLTFLNPLFISLLPLAAAPALFHLFFRLKKRPRPVSSLMFFLRLDPRLNARRRLREWLILLLRTLLLLFLLLALARPIWLGVGRERTRAVVLVIDNSGSMGGVGESGQSKLKEAIAAAHQLVAHLRAQDLVGAVLLVDDPAVPLPVGLSADKAALKTALDRIGETEATGGVTRALERAMTLLDSTTASRFEIHAFSDLQEEKWRQVPVELRVPRPGATLRIHRVATPPINKPNVSLNGASLPRQTALAGRRLPLQVELANPSGLDATVRLFWLDDSGNRNSQDLSLSARDQRSVTVVLEPANPGLRWVNFWIEGDGFQADNRASVAFVCSEKTTALFAGDGDRFGLLPLAISPFSDGRQSGLVSSFAGAGSWAERLRDLRSVFAIFIWSDIVQAGQRPAGSGVALQRFFEGGGRGLIVPSLATRETLGSPPAWLGVGLGNYEQREAGLPLRVLNPSAAVFDDLRDAKGQVALHNVKVFKFHPLRLAANDVALLGLEDGHVLLAEHQLGRGSLFVSGLAFDSLWSNLPLKPAFLALAQSMALTARNSSITNPVALVAGEPLAALPGKSSTLRVHSLAGSPLDWKGRRELLPAFPRSGVYAVDAEDARTYLAVRSSDKEGRQRFITSDQIPALGKLAYSVQTAGGGLAPEADRQRLGKSLDLALPLLLLALLALLTEGWLANPLPIRAAAGKSKLL